MKWDERKRRTERDLTMNMAGDAKPKKGVSRLPRSWNDSMI